MDIFTAIKKEKKYLKRFYILMLIIAIILPLAIYLTALTTPFFITFLAIIEFLILVAVVNKINYTKLKYSCSKNRLKFGCGLFVKEYLIFCDKVALVHTEKTDEDMEIIIVTSVNFKNKALKPAHKMFLKKYPRLKEEFIKITKIDKDQIFYYQVVKRGSLEKYMLLDCIYKNCVKAVYTKDAIQNIKIARGQMIV